MAFLLRKDGGIWDSKFRSLSLSATPASKALARMPRREREALLDKAEAFTTAPFAPRLAATPLRGRPDVIRLRQGDWRGIGRVDRTANTVVLEVVAHRREAYR
jgi:mRNA-degrading endonuclease RelE of RelBE toxin-antitoxin system